VAYALFFFSFSMWIAILMSVCLQNGRWTNPLQFPSFTFLMMFLGSAVASSVACMIIGLDYIGVGSESLSRARVLDKVSGSNVRVRKVSATKGDSDGLNGDYFVLSNFKEESEDLSLLVLVSKKQREKLQVSVRNDFLQLDSALPPPIRPKHKQATKLSRE